MKQTQIQTGKANLLVVDLPDGAQSAEIVNNFAKDGVIYTDDHLAYSDESMYTHYSMLPEGKWSILGFLSEITEEQAMSVVENQKARNVNETQWHTVPALETLNSLLQSAGVITVNPYPAATCANLSDCTCDGMYINECRDSFLKWQAAESHLWINPIILLQNGN